MSMHKIDSGRLSVYDYASPRISVVLSDDSHSTMSTAMSGHPRVSVTESLGVRSRSPTLSSSWLPSERYSIGMGQSMTRTVSIIDSEARPGPGEMPVFRAKPYPPNDNNSISNSNSNSNSNITNSMSHSNSNCTQSNSIVIHGTNPSCSFTKPPSAPSVMLEGFRQPAADAAPATETESDPDEPSAEPSVLDAVIEEFRKRVSRPGESPEEQRRKILLLPPALIMFLFFLVFLVYESASYDVSGPLRITLSAVVCLTLFVVVFVPLKFRRLPMRLVEVSVIILLLCALLSDLLNIGLYEQWFIAVFLMNAILLTEPDPRVLWSLFALTMSWIILRSMEDITRFGLYGNVPYNDKDHLREPLGWRWGISILILRCGVFSLDHALTKKFSQAVKKEKKALHMSVMLAEEIAEALVRFDLETAQALVTANDDSTALKGTLHNLLENLKMYRPYLPATVFTRGDEDAFAARAAVSTTDADSPALPGVIAPVVDIAPPPAVPPAATRIRPPTQSKDGSAADTVLTATEKEVLRERLDVGVRMRRGTLVRSSFETYHLGLDECYELVSAFAETILTQTRTWGGIVVDLKGPVIYSAWNTHLPCPRHAVHATRCCLRISSELRTLTLPIPFVSLCAASGQLATGSTGLDWQRAPFVVGTPLFQVDAMTMLSQTVRCRIIITEAVYEATRTQIASRLIDVISEVPIPMGTRDSDRDNDLQRVLSDTFFRPPEEASDNIGVFEVLEAPLTNQSLYADAFVALRGNRCDYAVQLFTRYLARVPDDAQAARLLRLAAAAKEHPSFLPRPYLREMVGWKRLEQEAEKLCPDEINALVRDVSQVAEPMTPVSTTIRPPTVWSSGSKAGEGLMRELRKASQARPRSPRRSRVVGMFPQEDVTSPASVASMSGADYLARDGVPSDSESAGDSSPQQSTPLQGGVEADIGSLTGSTTTSFKTHSSVGGKREFEDVDGSKWYKSDKMLGNGSFGEVWLGMGEDGGLVAMKFLKVHASKVPYPEDVPDEEQSQQDSACSDNDSWDEDLFGPRPDPTDPDWDEELQGPRPCAARRGRRRTDPLLLTRTTKGGANSESENTLQAIRKEVELLSQLRHENIVCYLSLAVTRNCIVINMEYVPGGSLQNVMQQFGRLPLSSTRRYIKDIIKGLRYLHKMDVAHRDFKPANVLLQIDGQCKLSDFGASIIMGDVVGKKVVGTLAFMAPEACRGEAGTGSDIWSVGVAMCQMITSELPFAPNLLSEPHAFLYQLASLKPGAMPQIPEGLADDAQAFVTDCLTPCVDARPTAEQLLLSQFLSI